MHISFICSIFAFGFILIYRLCLCVPRLAAIAGRVFCACLRVAFFLFVSYIGKMIQKIHFFAPKICTYQKKAVPLQRK